MNMDTRKPGHSAPTQQHRIKRGGRGLVGFLARVWRGISGGAPVPATLVISEPAFSHVTDTHPGVVRQEFPELVSRKQKMPDILTRTLDALRNPVVVVGPRQLISHVNSEARELFGEKVVGRNLALFFREPKALDAVNAVLDEGGIQTLEVNLDVPIQRQYKLTVTRLQPVPGEPLHAALEFQETTLIKRSESMRSEFVANVSHELRSPLATLIGFIETMQSASEDPGGIDLTAQTRFLGIMDGEAQRMNRMIDDLLSLTNVELREHERPRDRIDLVGVMREVVNALAARGKRHDVEIHLDCPADLPSVCGDRDQMIQVFHNLITNAIKYGGGGKVDVSVSATQNGLPDGGPSVQIIVRDYGNGIEAEHIPRLTERFYRIDKGRSRIMGGTGLGLAIVKHIVNRHRGRFQIESALGEGSSFCVRLPVYKGGL